MDKSYSVIPAAPGWFVVAIDEDNVAYVLPLAAWRIETCEVQFGPRKGASYVASIPLIGTSVWGDSGSIEEPMERLEYQVFGPGENPLHWAEQWEKGYGRKIAEWNVSNWWPSKSPVFATVDSVLWSDGMLPADDDGLSELEAA